MSVNQTTSSTTSLQNTDVEMKNSPENSTKEMNAVGGKSKLTQQNYLFVCITQDRCRACVPCGHLATCVPYGFFTYLR